MVDEFQAGHDYYYADSNDEKLILGRSAEFLEGYKDAWVKDQPSYKNSWLDPQGIIIDQKWDMHFAYANYVCQFGCERDELVCAVDECDARREHRYMTGFGGEFE